MFELLKIVGVSAVLSAGLVTASEMQSQPAAEPAGGKIYTDRVPEGEPTRLWNAVYTTDGRGDDHGTPTAREGKGDLLGKASQGGCAAQAWPHIAPECLIGERPSRGVRMITVEQRQGANVSVLVRVPASDLSRH